MKKFIIVTPEGNTIAPNKEILVNNMQVLGIVENVNDENELYKMCEFFTTNGIRFGISNVFENKGIRNQKLIDWCYKNDFNIYSFDKVAYSACGKGNSNAKEVFITNY